MALQKNPPKGISKSEWNKIRTIYYLIDNDVIVRDPSMTSYTDAPSYGSSKAKGAKQFISHYHAQYPGLFKKGKAGARLEEYVAKEKGRLQVKAKLQEYQDEGLVELPDFRFIDKQDQKDRQLMEQLDLSGGIFDVLQGVDKQTSKDEKSLQNIQNAMFPYAVKQSDSSYNQFKSLLPENYDMFDKSFVEYNNVSDLLTTGNIAAGPVRALISNYYSQLDSSALSLLNQVSRAYGVDDGDQLPSYLSEKVRDAINMAKGIADVMQGQNGELANGDKINGALTFLYPIPGVEAKAYKDAGSPKIGTTDANPYETSLSAISSLSIESANTKSGATDALKAILRFIKGKVASGETNVINRTKNELIRKQQDALISIREDVQQGRLYSRQAIAAELQDVYIKARRALKDGGIDEKAYRSIEKSLKTVRSQADTLPRIGALTEALVDGDITRVRDAKYKSLIISKTIENISNQLDQANEVAKSVKQLKDGGMTTDQVVFNLQKIFNIVSPVLTVTADELAKLKKDGKAYKTTPLDGTETDVTVTDLANAKSAVNSVQNGLVQARRASTERALQIYAYLIAAANKQFKLNLKVAYDIASKKTEGDMGATIKSQESAYALLTGDGPEAVKHRVDRVVKFYMPSNPMMAQNFINYGSDLQIIMAAAQVKGKLDNLMGATNIPQIMKDVVDPNVVLESLPANCRSMTNQQAEARAQAIVEYMQRLFTRFSSTCQGYLASIQPSMNFEDQRKAYEKQLGMLKDMFSEAKFDASCRNKDVVGYKAGLHFVGFTPKYTMEKNAMNTPTMAILTPGDLLELPIFRGQTYTDMTTDVATRQYPHSQKSLFAQEDYEPGKKAYMRRPIKDAFGNLQSIEWSPIQAHDLRNRYFCSLYPYALNSQAFNKIYQAKLNQLRGKQTVTSASADLMVDFGLKAAAATTAGTANRFGSGNRFGSRNRGRW
jgi:hypothetical protein